MVDYLITKSDGRKELYIAPLSNEMQRHLRDVCDELGLCGDTFDILEGIAMMLRDFETNDKPKLKSEQQKIKDLQGVEIAAKNLATAVSELDSSYQMVLSAIAPPTPVAQLTSEEPLFIPSIFMLKAQVSLLAKAASDLSKAELKNRPGSGGRVKTNAAYADFIRHIWDVVNSKSNRDRATPINLGRGGAFERLCEAVFTAAGVGISPEGPLRKFIKDQNAAANIPEDEPF